MKSIQFSQLADALTTVSWLRVSVELVNTRNIYAKEPLVSIFESIFKETMEKAFGPDPLPCFFHPAKGDHLPERVRKKAAYPLALILVTTDIGKGRQFVTALKDHLSDPYNNFCIQGRPEIEQRRLADVQKEIPDQLSGKNEVCLTFLTPFAFRPKIKNRPWWMSKPDFFAALALRMQVLFDFNVTFSPSDLDEVTILPYYWHYENRLRHRAKSSPGLKFINGTVGPLYIKGDLKKIWPLIVVCSELHAGRSLAYGRGFYRIKNQAPFFDAKLTDAQWLSRTIKEIEQTNDLADGPSIKSLFNGASLAERVHKEILDPEDDTGKAMAFFVPKQRGGERQIVSLDPKDLVVHKLLVALLQPVFNKMFEEESIGFRPARSKEAVKTIVAQACRQGYTHVLETDIESFFDHIEWKCLFDKLKHVLPESDTLTCRHLKKAITLPIEINHKTVIRSAGLLQGSPLSPLLSNLYLDSFDEAVHDAGLHHVRYGDDLIVFLRSEQEGEAVLESIRRILAALHLTLKPEKTVITPLDFGFTFLGQPLGYTLEEEIIEAAAFKKPVFVRPIYGFIGIDGNSLVIKKQKELIARIPLTRISELVIMGTNTLSTILLTRCSHEKIPVSFCSPAGYHVNTVFPDTKASFDHLHRHTQRFEPLSEETKTAISSELIDAKIINYMTWIKKRYHQHASRTVQALEKTRKSLVRADSLEQVRGYEGKAAAIVFSYVNQQVNARFPEFKSLQRVKHKKADPFNSLLDFAYFLLFTRVNTLVRSRGLNPYLGFLHSHKNHYESLVWDLMEPFRYRMDRMVVKTVNRRIIKADHFEMSSRQGMKNGYRLNRAGVGKFIEAFETDFHTRFKADGASLLQLIAAQVAVLSGWVSSGKPVVFYKSRP